MQHYVYDCFIGPRFRAEIFALTFAMRRRGKYLLEHSAAEQAEQTAVDPRRPNLAENLHGLKAPV